MEKNTIAPKKPEGKNPLRSRTIWGVMILSALNVADILTGDPWSVNGGVKWATLLIGALLGLIGRWQADKKLNWSAAAIASWFYNRSQGDRGVSQRKE